ncbi:hypothetical protein V8C86DRAFT_2951745 [Haematococcus lacustris]
MEEFGAQLLGMSGKDESSGSCEDLVMKISLPAVNTMAGEVNAESSGPCLLHGIQVPHSVMEERGSAKWDATKKTLTVTLPIVREARYR